jgi:hypothetical protein
VVREVTRRFAWFEGGEDEADALVLAAMGADWLDILSVTMPQTHRKALDAVAWPASPGRPLSRRNRVPSWRSRPQNVPGAADRR